MENYITKNISEHGTVYYCNSDKQLHRTDGPAVVWFIGGEEWCLFNKIYTKSEHSKLILFSVLETRRFI